MRCDAAWRHVPEKGAVRGRECLQRSRRVLAVDGRIVTGETGPRRHVREVDARKIVAGRGGVAVADTCNLRCPGCLLGQEPSARILPGATLDLPIKSPSAPKPLMPFDLFVKSVTPLLPFLLKVNAKIRFNQTLRLIDMVTSGGLTGSERRAA